MKLIRSPQGDNWRSRGHFCAVASVAMRQILIDHARKRAATARARDGAAGHATIMQGPVDQEVVDLMALDDALTRLAELDARQARLIELRFFGGLSNTEVADVLDVSVPTVERDWRRARAWLLGQLQGDGHG